MIDLKDLQLGDWVRHGNLYAPVEKVDYEGIILGGIFDGEAFTPSDIDPIDLTESIFKKLGFEYLIGTAFEGWQGHGIRIESDLVISKTLRFECKYLHQLQHLSKQMGKEFEIFLASSPIQRKMLELLDQYQDGRDLRDILIEALEWSE